MGDGAAVVRRVVFVGLLATLLWACGERVLPPTLAMRFEITRDARDAIGSFLETYAARGKFEFRTFDSGVDRSFILTRQDLEIVVAAGNWDDADRLTHKWPYEYQVQFYPTDRKADMQRLAIVIGSEWESIPGVRKSGPNFVPVDPFETTQ